MHISDGVLSPPVWIGSYVVSGLLVAAATRKMKPEEVPQVAVMTSVFFVASLIHIPLGPASVHLLLNGLVGIILGPLALVSVLLGLILQALLFQHGGITTIGANTLTMGLPALLAYRLFGLRRKVRFPGREAVFGAIGGVVGILGGAVILSGLLFSTGGEFLGVARFAALAHLPVMVAEAIISGFIVSFLAKVKPEVLK